MLYLFKLFEHSKHMIIDQIGNLWNFDSFQNCKISKIFYFLKLYNFEIFYFFKFYNFEIF